MSTKKTELEEYIHDLEERIDSEEEKSVKIVAEKKKIEGAMAELEASLVCISLITRMNINDQISSLLFIFYYKLVMLNDSVHNITHVHPM